MVSRFSAFRAFPAFRTFPPHNPSPFASSALFAQAETSATYWGETRGGDRGDRHRDAPRARAAAPCGRRSESTSPPRTAAAPCRRCGPSPCLCPGVLTEFSQRILVEYKQIFMICLRAFFGFRDSPGGKGDSRRQARQKPRAENRREYRMPNPEIRYRAPARARHLILQLSAVPGAGRDSKSRISRTARDLSAICFEGPQRAAAPMP